MKKNNPVVVSLFVFFSLQAFGQSASNACAGKTTLLCAIPNIYAGFGGQATAPLVSFAATATQLTLLPGVSPASGFIYEYDPQTGLYARTSESLGPVLTERGETVGRHKFFFGASFQRFRFSKIDGIDLHNLPAVIPISTPLGQLAIPTRSSLDIKMNQYSVYGTYGLTNRLDVSVSVPFYQVGFNVNSVGVNPLTGTQVQVTNSGANTAAGVGDVVVRVKANLYHSDRVSFAALTDVRIPTGNPNNFTGSGAMGVKPLAALSVRAGMLTPHINLGYQWNGSSVIGGNPFLGTKGNLPSFAVFSVGTDLAVSRHITVSGDYLGQELVNAPRLAIGQLGGLSTVELMSGSLANQSDAAVGVKISAGNHFLITANAIISLNDTGLREKIIPLVALSYAF